MRRNYAFFHDKIQLPFEIKRTVLALGSQTKNTICFAQGRTAFISRTHQDLTDPEDFTDFENDVNFFLKRRPDIIASDLHPEYTSTKYALRAQGRAGRRVAQIQHHHAHIVSCMAENGLKNQKVIGVAFDGTGYGSDSALWGGEFLVCDYKYFKRAAHLKEIALVSGQQAIRQPWRIAAFWLYAVYGEGFLDLKNDFVRKIDRKKWRLLKKMLLAGFNSPKASSIGRLFDAVASLVLVKLSVRREAELAIELEKAAISYQLSAISYPFKVSGNRGGRIIDPSPMFKAIARDCEAKEAKGKIAYRFHLSIAEMIRRVCLILRKEHKTGKVVLSGGVFQNKLLLRLAVDLLYKDGLRVFVHNKLSCNDSGISLGQAVIAAERRL